MFVSSLPFIVAMTILLKICKFLEMLINHFQIEKQKIQVFLLGFFVLISQRKKYPRGYELKKYKNQVL
jgi:uncharacterized protein YhhL (DUF1145 family)